MPLTFKPLPPDHPIFSLGPSFVFDNSQQVSMTDDDSTESESEDDDE